MKGVLLKTVQSSLEYIYGKPKQLNEFYFILVASDRYKVVFSWNDIYNTALGNRLYILTEMNGKAKKDQAQRINCISTGDLIARRRYIKGLEKIIVNQVD